VSVECNEIGVVRTDGWRKVGEVSENRRENHYIPFLEVLGLGYTGTCGDEYQVAVGRACVAPGPNVSHFQLLQVGFIVGNPESAEFERHPA
jgi:hypothetical protein